MPVSYGNVLDPSDHSLLLREPDTSKAYVLDTNVLIDMSYGIPANLPDDVKFAVSTLSLLELAAPRHMDLDRADGVLASIKVSELIPVTQEVARLAVELRHIQNLDIIDACIGATACYRDAILLTNDQRLLRHPVVPALPFPILEITKENNK